MLGEAEVGDFGEDRVGRGGKEDVLRLQIAMDDALLVREGEAFEGLEDDGAGQLQGQPAAVGGHEGVEAAAGAILHDEIENPFAGTHIEDGHDVRMAERGGAADFAEEFIAAGLIHGGAGQHDFDGDALLVFRPPGAIGGPEAAAAQLLFDDAPGFRAVGNVEVEDQPGHFFADVLAAHRPRARAGLGLDLQDGVATRSWSPSCKSISGERRFAPCSGVSPFFRPPIFWPFTCVPLRLPRSRNRAAGGFTSTSKYHITSAQIVPGQKHKSG